MVLYDDLSNEQKEKLNMLLKLGCNAQDTSLYMGFKNGTVRSWIQRGFIKRRTDFRFHIKYDKINELLRMKNLLESGMVYTRELRNEFPDWKAYQICNVMKKLGYERKIARPKPKLKRYRMITLKDSIEKSVSNNKQNLIREHTAGEYFSEKGSDVYILINVGADLLLKRNGKITVVEVKRTLHGYNITNAILQLIMSKDILKRELNITADKLLIVSSKINFQKKGGKETYYKRFFKHFNVDYGVLACLRDDWM